MPFVKLPSKELTMKTELDLSEAFGAIPMGLIQKLQSCTVEQKINVLDEWLMKAYKQHQNTSIFSEAIQEFGNDYSLQNVLSAEGYSYSTLERHFKKEAGLTPKQYQCLRRYKSAIIEIYETQNPDWAHYVQKYGYFDQSHFIKDIKRFTGFTPSQLLETPSLLSFRSVRI
jgi:AraC-like DNA-binding protein